MKRTLLACGLLVLFGLCLWGTLSIPDDTDCMQRWQETTGVVLSVTPSNYTYSCFLNGSIVKTINQRYEVVIATQNEKDNSLRLFTYCSSMEKYWCCNENQCNLTTIYHDEAYWDCYFFVSFNNTFTTLNVSVNQEVIAYYNDMNWEDGSPYAFDDYPLPWCVRTLPLTRILSIIGLVIVSIVVLCVLLFHFAFALVTLVRQRKGSTPNSEPFIQ
jgi:hypothetical protein